MTNYRNRVIESQRLCANPLQHDCNMETLGERVAKARKERGMSQTELAERIGSGQSHISGIESGARNKRPDIVMLAHALGVDSYWLKTGVETIIAGDKQINDVVRLMKETSATGRAIVLDKASDIAKQYPSSGAQAKAA